MVVKKAHSGIKRLSPPRNLHQRPMAVTPDVRPRVMLPNSIGGNKCGTNSHDSKQTLRLFHNLQGIGHKVEEKEISKGTETRNKTIKRSVHKKPSGSNQDK